MSGWARLWHDMPTDPKWRVISKRSGRSISEVMAVFIFMMTNASANADERGRTKNLNAEDIAAALDLETGDIDAILSAMEGKVVENGFLSGWEKRQPKREDNSAERARKWREERKRTQANAVERPDIDIDSEIDIELEPKGSRATQVARQADDEQKGDQDEGGDKLLPKHVVEKWNEIAPTLGKPCVRDLTPERRQNLKARIAQYKIEDFLQVFDNISTSPFLRGDTGKNFCNFDWAMKKANFQKILEGNYNNG